MEQHEILTKLLYKVIKINFIVSQWIKLSYYVNL